MKFKDSVMAHKYLDNLKGVEIGAASHNPFNLPDCINVDYSDKTDTLFSRGEFKLCGEYAKVDVVAEGDDLPFEDESYDYVISSHVIEHFFDPIAAIEEWFRVIKPGGYIFIIAPKQKALRGETRDCTHYTELLDRHSGKMTRDQVDMRGYQTSTVTGIEMRERGHWSVWNLRDFMQLCVHMRWKMAEARETDDKVGNGFTVILQKP